MRRVLGIVVGMIVGVVVVSIIQFASTLNNPMPAELDMTDREALQAWIDTLPTSAFVIVLLSHAAGAFIGAFTCLAIVRENWKSGWFTIGVLFLIAGVINLFAIPHPTWFGVADVLIYIPAAWLGGKFAIKLFGSSKKLTDNNSGKA